MLSWLRSTASGNNSLDFEICDKREKRGVRMLSWFRSTACGNNSLDFEICDKREERGVCFLGSDSLDFESVTKGRRGVHVFLAWKHYFVS